MVFVKILFVLVLLYLIGAVCFIFAMRPRPRPENGLPGRLNAFLYAHRGLHAIPSGIPENSVRAFQLAAKYGYGAELDVHLSRDGRLVVMHDENLKRTTGANANISAVTSQVLNQLNLEGTREKVPYLEDVLPLFENRGPLLIELKTEKGNYVELTRKVCNLLKSYPNLEFFMESFDPRVLLWLKKHRPDIIRGQLSFNYRRHQAEGVNFFRAFLLSNLLFNFLTKPDFIAYDIEDKDDLGPALCRKLWNPEMAYWVVSDQETVEAARAENALVIFEGFAAK